MPARLRQCRRRRPIDLFQNNGIRAGNFESACGTQRRHFGSGRGRSRSGLSQGIGGRGLFYAASLFFKGAKRSLVERLGAIADACHRVEAIAARPGLAAKPLIMLVGFAPLCTAVVLFATMGNFTPGYLMLVAGAKPSAI
jgi:hypothetical protein